jgi:hypothetical protein
MIRVLVPVEAFSHLTLSATYFALEFAKRHPAKIFFLILDGPEAKTRSMERITTAEAPWPALFQQLLQRGREQQVNLVVHHSQEDYLTAISSMTEQYNIDDIIIAVPPPADQAHSQIQRLIELLRHQVHCHIITVKPKEIGKILDSWGKKKPVP